MRPRTIPGSSIGGDRPAALNPSAGLWPPVPGRYRIASATSRPLEREQRDRPPGWRAVEAEVARQCREDVLLCLGDQLQEEVGHGCDRDTDDGAQCEQPEIAVGLEQLDGIRQRRRFRWVRGTRHSSSLPGVPSSSLGVQRAAASRIGRATAAAASGSRRDANSGFQGLSQASAFAFSCWNSASSITPFVLEVGEACELVGGARCELPDRLWMYCCAAASCACGGLRPRARASCDRGRSGTRTRRGTGR